MSETPQPLLTVDAPAPIRGSLPRVLRRALLWLVILGAAAGGAYWAWFAPAAVTVHTVQRGEIVAEVLGTGTLESHISATISPKISGLVTAVLVDQGDRVEAGQILVRLDDGDLRRQVEVAESTLGAAHAAVERQKADRARTLAILDLALYDFERVENLVKQSTAATTEFQEATKALRVGEADVARADAALVEVQKQVIAAEKALEYQQAKLSDTVVRAPCAGLIVRRDRHPGDVVVPGSSMLFLVSTDELWISAWVDETEMARLKAGQPARIMFREEPGRSRTGEVARLGREVDRETREFLVDVRVDDLPENWAMGQRAEVYVETGRLADVVALPTRFIVWRDGQAGTFVEKHGHAEWRPLRLGLRGRETVAVTEGLGADDSVLAVEARGASLKAGQRVAIAPGDARASAGSRP